MAKPLNVSKSSFSVFALALLWIGLLIGVSFLATPAKFLAASLTLPVALDVGRHTFAIFNRVEWFLAAAFLVLTLLRPRDLIVAAGGIISALIVLFETLWLLPLLDQRVGLIIAGEQPPPSSDHIIYIIVEVLKLFVLGVVAAVTAYRLFTTLPSGADHRAFQLQRRL